MCSGKQSFPPPEINANQVFLTWDVKATIGDVDLVGSSDCGGVGDPVALGGGADIVGEVLPRGTRDGHSQLSLACF